MERIEKILKDNGVETYFIRKTDRQTRELFFIKKKLDIRRTTHTVEYNVTVYRDSEKDGKKLRAMSTILLGGSDSDEEIAGKIKSAVYAAGFAMNPYFDLARGEVSETVAQDSDLAGMTMDEIETGFVQAVYGEDQDPKSFINTYELFLNDEFVSMKGSNGCDVSYTRREVTGEFVAQCKEPQDVETYQNFSYDSYATGELSKLVRDTLKLTGDRAQAKEMPRTGNYDVLLSGKYMPDLMGFFLDRANAAYVYQQYSNYEVGKKVQGEEVKGEILNMDLGVTEPFNPEGIRMVCRPFIKEGVLQTLHGSQRFSRYLNMEPVGTYGKVILHQGSQELAEMKKNCLHVVNFSDFQMDSLDGHFKGEIRLAYLYDGDGNVSLVTGGSVNGSIFEGLGNLSFSKEQEKLSTYEGPEAVKLVNIAVSGR